MKLPEIGGVITTEFALELCDYYDIGESTYLINKDPSLFKPWKFDGCSCLPDKLMGLFTGCSWADITYKCCLPHDLRYAYGEPFNEYSRERADYLLYLDLINKAKMERWIAKVFKKAVELGGSEKLGLSFSWGFARL